MPAPRKTRRSEMFAENKFACVACSTKFRADLGGNVGPDNPLNRKPAQSLSFRWRVLLPDWVVWIFVVLALLGRSGLHE
jgi:hypothetical protein